MRPYYLVLTGIAFLWSSLSFAYNVEDYKRDMAKLKGQMTDFYNEKTTTVKTFDCKTLDNYDKSRVSVGVSGKVSNGIETKQIWEYGCGNVNYLNIRSAGKTVKVKKLTLVDVAGNKQDLPVTGNLKQDNPAKEARFDSRHVMMIIVSSESPLTEDRGRYELTVGLE